MKQLSVIIPTKNRPVLLKRALKSLTNQTISQDVFEVIVVDNGSTDNTADVVDSFKSKLKNIRYFMEPQPGLHAGRHKGCIVARSNFLVYADDDIEAFPTWLQAIKDSFNDESVVLVGGKCLPQFEIDPPQWLNTMWSPNAEGVRILGYLSLIDLGNTIKAINPFHVFGCNFSIRRKVLMEAGGFNPDAMPQELIRLRGDGETAVSRYIKTKGYKALYNPLASVYHWVPVSRMTTEYFGLRSYNQGISDSFTAIRQSMGVDVEPLEAIDNQKLYQRVCNKCVHGMIGAAFQMVRWLALQKKDHISTVNEEAALRRNLAAAHKAGYDYHQKLVGESPELLAWVVRSDYWD